MTVRVVLVDDQALIRAGFGAIIDSADDLAGRGLRAQLVVIAFWTGLTQLGDV